MRYKGLAPRLIDKPVSISLSALLARRLVSKFWRELCRIAKVLALASENEIVVHC